MLDPPLTMASNSKVLNFLPPAYVVQWEGNVMTGVCLSTGGGPQVLSHVLPRGEGGVVVLQSVRIHM